MSQRPPAKDPPPSSLNDGKEGQAPQPLPQYAQTKITAPQSYTSSPSSARYAPPPTRGFELPPLPQMPSSTGGSFSPSASRLAGVSSMLNPTQAELYEQQSRRRKAAELESPLLPQRAALAPLVTSTHPVSTIPGLAEASPVSRFPGLTEGPPRHILTPRSPSLHRAASLSQLNPCSATIDAQQSPFLSPRAKAYTIEPGVSGVPPLPTPPALLRQSYGFAAVAPTPPPQQPVPRASAGYGGHGRADSASASPSTSYSSYSVAEQTSPVSQFGPVSLATSTAPYTLAYPSTSWPGISGPSAASAPSNIMEQERQRPYGIPISSASGSQSTYQLMTLETTSGTVQLPVDVQAASRVADEKRKRNAGASARFRQRRKEKEREASTTISKLEQQLRDATEDAQFYKNERNYFTGIMMQIPGTERHFPRPPSPRHRRAASAATAAGSSASAGFMNIQESGLGSPESNRSIRRRTSTFSLPAPAPPMHTIPPIGHPEFASQQHAPTPQQQQQQQPNAPPGPSLMLSPTPRTIHHGVMGLPVARPLPRLMQASPQTGPYNPFAPDPSYDRARPPSPPPPPPSR
ncbi:hypothetical protein LTR50_005765 [Elasticomyces elasticus]|nr:hypothetical protein LTR50_005765 [Elasticomyces elasticus]